MLLETRECGSTRYRYNEKASAGLNGPGYVGWYLCRRFCTCLHKLPCKGATPLFSVYRSPERFAEWRLARNTQARRGRDTQAIGGGGVGVGLEGEGKGGQGQFFVHSMYVCWLSWGPGLARNPHVINGQRQPIIQEPEKKKKKKKRRVN